MSGHMGHEQVTTLNLEVVEADPERNLLLVQGLGARSRTAASSSSATPSRARRAEPWHRSPSRPPPARTPAASSSTTRCSASSPTCPLMHQVVTAQLAARRAGTQSTKTRAEVRGGGAQAVQAEGHRQRPPGLDPRPALQRWWRRPRAQAAQVRPEDPEEDDQGWRCARRCPIGPPRARSLVVDAWGFDAPKTKQAVKLRSTALGVDGRALVVRRAATTPTPTM